ncbi:MAG: gliding motility-associated C-terminal domain-containing protein [Schleiferiaceae bacterium]|nr:gliding motility-associated C-terminal domain-containing protein [Schleiferiaceae bacterium]
MYKYILSTLVVFFVAFGASAQEKAHINPHGKECPILMPNAFTPNYDGVNDFFFFTFQQDCTPTTFSLQIYDRLGRLVFETKDYEAKWDGQYDGQDLADGTYFWVMKSSLTLPEESEPTTYSKKGSVLIVR